MTVDIRLENDGQATRALQEALTARLPRWFGRPESNRHYAAQAEILPAYVARAGGRDCGLLLMKRHGAASAEIYWMAVDPDCHRAGIGSALLNAACDAARAEKRRLMVVLTLGVEIADENYRKTLAFYERNGFFHSHTEHGVVDPLSYYVKLLAD
jgi:GNAT superfamily N-acetyltransferase